MGVHNFDIMRFLDRLGGAARLRHVTTYGTIGRAGAERDDPDRLRQWRGRPDNGCRSRCPRQGLTGSQHLYTVVGEPARWRSTATASCCSTPAADWETIWEQPPIDFVNRPLEPTRLEAFYTQTQAFVDDVLDGRDADRIG